MNIRQAQLPKGWEIKKLGEVYDVRDGTHDSPIYVKEGYALITSKNLKNNRLNYDNVNYITEQDYNNINKRSKVDIGDVLFAMIGTIGNPIVIIKEPDFAIKNVALFKIPKNQDSYFLKYYLDSGKVIDKMSKDAKGATQKFVGLGYLREFPIPIPPLPEQQRIVAILDEAFAVIERSRNNAEQNLKNAKELFESYLQGVFDPSTRSGQGKKGDGWEEKTIKEVCELKPQKKEARDKLRDTDLVTFLPMEDLGVLTKEIVGIKEKQLKDVAGSYTYFADNDVLLAKITPCFENGKIGIARNLINGIGFGSSEYVVFRTLGQIEPEYLYFFLSRNRIREEGRKYMSGAVGHKRISKDWIENYIIQFPKSLKEQQSIVSKLDALRAETQKLEAVYQKKIKDLEELKKSILQKAFEGEI
ncbi:MAG: hypothetical protein A2X64_08855 [Ignavibacteria bacterium GWF2_33_9]|nr:MAG: hypothetical protein A2X64_08855 [Ignavibacteria bacterium GWF2_33_9]